MSDSRKHKKAWLQRQEDDYQKTNHPDFDGRRYGNKRKAVAVLKVKDRRRHNRQARRELLDYEEPPASSRKHIMD